MIDTAIPLSGCGTEPHAGVVVPDDYTFTSLGVTVHYGVVALAVNDDTATAIAVVEQVVA